MLRTIVFEANPLPLDLEALPPPVRDLLLDLQAQVFAKSAQSAAKDAQVAQLEELGAARDTWIQELEHLTKRQECEIALNNDPSPKHRKQLFLVAF